MPLLMPTHMASSSATEPIGISSSFKVRQDPHEAVCLSACVCLCMHVCALPACLDAAAAAAAAAAIVQACVRMPTGTIRHVCSHVNVCVCMHMRAHACVFVHACTFTLGARAFQRVPCWFVIEEQRQDCLRRLGLGRLNGLSAQATMHRSGSIWIELGADRKGVVMLLLHLCLCRRLKRCGPVLLDTKALARTGATLLTAAASEAGPASQTSSKKWRMCHLQCVI